MQPPTSKCNGASAPTSAYQRSQPSRSPQDILSSTQHVNEQQHHQENETRLLLSGSYSKYRHVAPKARGHFTVGSLRAEHAHNPNRPEVAVPAIEPYLLLVFYRS
uniref:(northern house mosquito) hypothetical protein n=1 Tax=Culex pipiens TaxID=7175 RepID=A0A8D8EV81_CULPI